MASQQAYLQTVKQKDQTVKLTSGPKVGDRWGRCRCIGSGYIDVEVQRVNQPVWETIKIGVYQIRCDCGRVMSVRQDQFKGKRGMVDCGRCGLGKAEGKLVQVFVNIPMTMVRRADKWAREQNLGLRGEVWQELIWYVWNDGKGRQVGKVPKWWGALRVNGRRDQKSPVRNIKTTVRIGEGMRDRLTREGQYYGVNLQRVLLGLWGQALIKVQREGRAEG